MRRLGFVVGLALLAPAPLVLAPDTAAAGQANNESNIHAAYVKVGLTWDKSTHRHPGFLMAIDEEGVFEIQCDGRTHAITVSFLDASEKVLTLSIKYEINGTTQWVDQLEVEAGVDTVLQKGKAKLTFNVDPQGSEDTSTHDLRGAQTVRVARIEIESDCQHAARSWPPLRSGRVCPRARLTCSATLSWSWRRPDVKFSIGGRDPPEQP